MDREGFLISFSGSKFVVGSFISFISASHSTKKERNNHLKRIPLYYSILWVSMTNLNLPSSQFSVVLFLSFTISDVSLAFMGNPKLNHLLSVFQQRSCSVCQREIWKSSWTLWESERFSSEFWKCHQCFSQNRCC